MTEIVKETITTAGSSSLPQAEAVVNIPTTAVVSDSQTIEYLIYFVFGILETLLAFRLVLKLTGASMLSPFVRFIYGLTGIFVAPFVGIFRRGFSEGIETTSIMEPAVIVALIVYSLLAFGIVKLLRIYSREQPA